VAEEEEISSTLFGSVAPLHSLCHLSIWNSWQGIKNGDQYYRIESNTEDRKLVLPHLRLSSGPTQYRDSQSIPYVSVWIESINVSHEYKVTLLG
jgi:hypothetical protein